MIATTESGLQVCSFFHILCSMKRSTILILVIALFTTCKNNSKTEDQVDKVITDSIQNAKREADSLLKIKIIQDSILAENRKDSILLKLTQNILISLKNKNYRAFSNYIHPVQGIRFSPYGHIDTIKHVKFSKASFLSQANKDEQDMIIWGSFDGTGDPIRMTLNNYLQRFVYDVDFAKAENLKVNEFIGNGNSINNLLSVYKDCDFTESHFSGFEEKYAGMDWKSLRLVFKQRNGRYLLVGIVHDEWTI